MTNHSFTARPGAFDAVTTYVFNAPREKVFAAYIRPESIPQWWGPKNEQTSVEEMNVQTGGSWQFTIRGREDEFTFRGVYHEVNAPERLVATWQFLGMPTVALQIATFEETNGKTTLTDRMIFQSVADRDAMLEAGMDGGSVDMLERLAELVGSAFV